MGRHRYAPLACAIAVAFSLATLSAAQAQSLFERFLASGACYARSYDAAHLAKRPRQTVTHFHLRRAEPDPLRAQNSSRFTVAFGFWVKDAVDLYATLAECRSTAAGAQCLVEGDGGSFTLAQAGNALRVTVSRMEVEGAKTFSQDLAHSDNRVMLLYPSNAAACADK